MRRIRTVWVTTGNRSLAAKSVAALILLLVSTGCADDLPTTPDGKLGSSEMRIDSVTPAVGSTIVPTTVTIRGAGFESGAAVLIGDTVLQTLGTGALLTVVIPARPPGVQTLMVRNPNGRAARFENGFRFESDLPTDPADVRVTGQLLAGGSDVPFAGASMRLLQGLTVPQPSVTTDDDGQFTLTGSVPGNIERLLISVTRTGVGSWIIELPRSGTDQVVLRVPNLLLIRAGRAFRSALTPGPDLLLCTIEGVPCVRLVVDGPPGTLIDLELIPENGQTVGLILVEPFVQRDSYLTRLTVPPTIMWIMGAFGPFTLKAHHVQTASR